MSDFLKEFEAYKGEGDEVIWKERANSLVRAILSGMKFHPFYKADVSNPINILYLLTDKNQFLHFYNYIVENLPRDPKILSEILYSSEMVNLLSFMSAHDGLESDGGIKMFNNAAAILEKYLEKHYHKISRKIQ